MLEHFHPGCLSQVGTPTATVKSRDTSACEDVKMPGIPSHQTTDECRSLQQLENKLCFDLLAFIDR